MNNNIGLILFFSGIFLLLSGIALGVYSESTKSTEKVIYYCIDGDGGINLEGIKCEKDIITYPLDLNIWYPILTMLGLIMAFAGFAINEIIKLDAWRVD